MTGSLGSPVLVVEHMFVRDPLTSPTEQGAAAEASAEEPWLNDLNPEQRAAVTVAGGPLLVIAGAGSGKTRTLASRVAWLVDRAPNPSASCCSRSPGGPPRR